MGGTARKAYAPRSRTQDERPITREHNSFSRGMYRDMPASDIPEMGEADIFNFNNFGKYLESRTGSIEWGDHENGIPAAELPESYGPYIFYGKASSDGLYNEYRLNVVAPGENYIWTWIGDDNSVGWFLGVDHGSGIVYEEVVDIIGPGSTGIIARTIPSVLLGDTEVQMAGTVVAPVHTIFFSEYHDKFIIHLGGNIYSSDDIAVSSWERITISGTPYSYDPNFGSLDVAANLSSMVEFIDRIAFFTNAGIYNINVAEGYFFQVNTAVPESLIEHINADTIDPQISVDDTTYKYGRKRVYSLSRITGNGVRDRQTPGSIVEWESGGALPDPDQNFRDYGVQFYLDESSAVGTAFNGDIRGLSPVTTKQDAPQSLQATHYSVYGTENMQLAEGIENLGNDPENLIWELDIPVSWITVVTVVSSPAADTYIVTLSNELPKGLLNVVVEEFNGDLAFIGIQGADIYYKTNRSLSPGNTTFLSYGLASVAGVFSFTGNTITASQAVDLTVGETVYFSGGQTAKVVSISSTTEFTVDSVSGLVVGDYFGGKMSAAPSGSFTIGAISYEAGFDSSVTDNTLYNRSDVYFMPNRFWEPMADGELGDIFGAFAFVGSRESQTVQYCQLAKNFERFFGQHNKPTQYHNLGDTATQISRFKGLMSVKCLASTITFSLTAYTVGGNVGAARFLFIINSANEVSDTIGCVGPWAVAKVDGSNTEMVLTNEPGLRVFNGTSYGANMLKDRILDDLKSIGQNFAVSYSDENGLIIWSVENDN